jgi:Neuraminidase (sialidase)
MGLNWAATGPQDVWHSLSSSDDGQVMVAGQAEAASFANSMLSLSTDGGQTWTERADLGAGIWIASAVSSDGNRIVAATLDGRMVMSSDRGATFSAVTLPIGVTAPSFESVTLSDDGSRIAAAAMNGPVIVGNVAEDGAVTWITPTGLPATAGWRSIDSSATGQVMVAVAEDPAAFISTDAGATWAPLTVAIGDPAAPVLDQNWYRVKVSGDGNTIALAANAFGGSSGNGIYVSKDGGGTFTRPHELVTDYSGIAMSADGGVIAVTHSSNASTAGDGQVLLSTNGGATFAPVAVTVAGAPVTESNWRSVAMSADGTRMAVAAGRFITNSAGAIYLTSGTRP